MTKKQTLFSIIESPTHPFLTPIFNELGIEELCFRHMRKLISKIKKVQPDYIAAEFFYGYGNNYAGINISNLDVMLYSLQRYSAKTKVIVFVDKSEKKYLDKLNEILPLYAVITHPVTKNDLLKVLLKAK